MILGVLLIRSLFFVPFSFSQAHLRAVQPAVIEGEGLELVTQNIFKCVPEHPANSTPKLSRCLNMLCRYFALSRHTDTLIACELAIQLASWSDQNKTCK